MLTFRPLSLADKPWIDKHVREENSRSADFNFGNMFLWDKRYRQMVADDSCHLVTLCCAYEHPVFPFPIGCGTLQPVIEKMWEYAAANGFPLVIRGLERHHMEALERLYPGVFQYQEDRDWEDYLYDIDRLIDLPGKKLHGKRNHIARFTETYDWHAEALTPALFPQCRGLLARWAAEASDTGGSVEGEHDAIERAFAHYDVLGLLGCALFAGDMLIAFAIGEPISTDTFDVHFEKAEAEINGAYPMINREFLKLVRARYPDMRYVNREDDMGLENLRRSKESYYPDFLLEKFTARREV